MGTLDTALDLVDSEVLLTAAVGTAVLVEAVGLQAGLNLADLPWLAMKLL